MRRRAGALPLLAVLLACGPAGCAGSADERDVDALLQRYFEVWSRGDLDAYRDCFHPEAVIHYVERGTTRATPLVPFLESQRLAHARASAPLREIPLSLQIDLDGDVARARVRWRLFEGEREMEGTDWFTLLRTPRGWRIVGLVFQQDM